MRLDGVSSISTQRVPMTDRKIVYYSGDNTNNNMHWLGMIIPRRIQSSVVNFVSLSDKILIVQLQGEPNNIKIFQVYAPNAEKPQYAAIGYFKEQLKQHLQYTRYDETTVILADLSAKIRKDKLDNIIGEYGLVERNSRSDRLAQFCQGKNFAVIKTWSRLPPHRLHTKTCSGADVPLYLLWSRRHIRPALEQTSH